MSWQPALSKEAARIWSFRFADSLQCSRNHEALVNHGTVKPVKPVMPYMYEIVALKR